MIGDTTQPSNAPVRDGPILRCAALVGIVDPHVCARRPARRRESDWLTLSAGNLIQAAGVCRARGAAALITGDLTERARETDLRTLSALSRALRTFDHVPLTNVGNHDLIDDVLSEGTALALMRDAGLIHVTERSGAMTLALVGNQATAGSGGKRVAIGATPYGQEIPLDATGAFDALLAEAGWAASSLDAVVWTTHHDVASHPNGAYPGAVEAFGIKGCHLVLNGHIHTRQPVREVDGTTWLIPGNILRQTIAEADHVEAVTVIGFEGGGFTLETVALEQERDVFDQTGRQVQPIAPGEPDSGAPAPLKPESVFVELLKAEIAADMQRSDDGGLLAEDLHRLARDMDMEPDVVAYLEDLRRAVVEKAGSPGGAR